jgi:hypothetical protein
MPNANDRAKAKIQATRKDLAQARMAGFHTTSDALASIYGNLATTQHGIARSQTVANRRVTDALARLSGKTNRATGRLISGEKAAAANQYGAVAAAGQDKASGTLEAHGKAAGLTLAGEGKAGAVGVKGAASVLDIIKAGAATARAGAKGQLADALAYRAQNDAQVVAGLQQARLTAQLQFQTWKKQQDYLAKQQAKDTTGALGGVRTVADTAGDASVWLREWFAANPGQNAAAAIGAYTSSHYLDPNAQPMLGMLANSVAASVDENGQTKAGYTRADETKDVMQAVHTLYPNFAKVKDTVAKVISSRWDSYDADAAAKAAEDAANKGADGRYVAPGSGSVSEGSTTSPTGKPIEVSYADDGRRVDITREQHFAGGTDLPVGFAVTKQDETGYFAAPVI